MVVDTRYYEILQVKTDADELTIKKVWSPSARDLHANVSLLQAYRRQAILVIPLRSALPC
jgi:DnaJ-class molecular chaperone